MLTVSELEGASLGGVRDAARAVRKAASHLRHEGTEYGRGVRTPLYRGEDWKGAGLHEAKAVVEADGLAIFTAASRLTVAANTMTSFADGIADCKATLNEQKASAEDEDMTVKNDGTVEPKESNSQSDAAAKRYEKKIKQQLRMASRLDKVCAAALTRLTGKSAGGKSGYGLPVFSAYAGGDLLKRSRKAYSELYTNGPDLQATSFAFSSGLWEDKAVGTQQCMRKGDLPPGGGFILGPDMQLYPIATAKNVYDNQGDAKWHTIGSRVGMSYFDLPSKQDLDRARSGAIMVGAIDNGKVAQASWADAEQTRQAYGMLANGSVVPSLPSGTDVPRQPIQNTGRTNEGIDAKGGAFQIGMGATQGAVVAKHMDDNYAYAYRTTYQQSDDGQVRAIVERYKIGYDSNNERHLYAYSSRLGEDGHFQDSNLEHPNVPSMHRPTGD